MTELKPTLRLPYRKSPLEMLKKHLPILILIGALVAVFVTNFSPSTFLIGWDNRLQELNPLLNLKRYIFSVWQEYQGLGLLAGHAHASEIPHALFILFLSIFLPLNLIRQVFTFLMLAVGVVGAYFLVRKLVYYKNQTLNKFVPLIGALFYLFNLATIQTFYAPLEPFIIHFAFLPWLLLSALFLLANKTPKALALFVIVNIMAIPQAQIPTVFLVYFLALVFFLGVLILETRRKDMVIRSIKIILITLILNSFWLLPFIYFFFTNSQVAFTAKINQMSTDTIFLQNKEFGNISDVMLLKGFWFNNIDPNLQGNFTSMLLPWINHLTSAISAVGYFFFFVILIGITYIREKKPFVIPFAALFILSFTMLATNTPPFSWVDSILRDVPVFKEIFRFPFTKFSIVAALTYSYFFAIGVGKIALWFEKQRKPIKLNFYPIAGVFIVLLILFIFPVFKGNLFYSKEKIKIPEEYTRLFEFLKTQNPNARIANFPQYTFWGWNFYSWGYGGSGFLWYGINQPILDRAFDVWSQTDENYYWELSYALYSKNPELFANVLNKYQISYLLFDKNIINPTSPKALFKQEFVQMMSQIPQISKATSFGNLDLYKVTLKDNVNNFLYLTGSAPSINSYQWGNSDKAYSLNPNYLAVSTNNSEYFYPFRSVFSGKDEENQEFKTEETKDSINFTSDSAVPQGLSKINMPITGEENLIVANFTAVKNAGNITLSVNLKTPQVYIGNTKIWGESITKKLFIIEKGVSGKFNLNLNGRTNFSVDLANLKTDIGATYISPTEQSVIVLNNGKSSFQAFLAPVDIRNLLQKPTSFNLGKNLNGKLSVQIPKVTDDSQSFTKAPSQALAEMVKNCESFKKGTISSSLVGNEIQLSSENATACLSFYLSDLSHNQGYLVSIKHQNILGRPLHFWVLNENEKISPIDTYLNKDSTLSYFIIPSYEQFGAGYSLNVENISIAEETTNKLGKISLLPIPYDFLTSILLSKGSLTAQQPEPALDVRHPNESLYTTIYRGSTPSNLVLSQSYNPGWKAYEIKNSNFLVGFLPFIFGTELKNHVLVNNWENGWVLDDPKLQNRDTELVIVFLPQYLEYLGFIVFAVFIIIVVVKKRIFI